MSLKYIYWLAKHRLLKNHWDGFEMSRAFLKWPMFFLFLLSNVYMRLGDILGDHKLCKVTVACWFNCQKKTMSVRFHTLDIKWGQTPGKNVSIYIMYIWSKFAGYSETWVVYPQVSCLHISAKQPRGVYSWPYYTFIGETESQRGWPYMPPPPKKKKKKKNNNQVCNAKMLTLCHYNCGITIILMQMYKCTKMNYQFHRDGNKLAVTSHSYLIGTFVSI